MTTLNFTLGKLEPVPYFIAPDGSIASPLTMSEALKMKDKMQRRGYEFRTADTLREVDKLQKLMQEHELKTRQAELEREELTFADVRKQIRDRLYARMVSSSTTQYEKDFIAAYFRLGEEKREKYRRRFLADQCYFLCREFDNPSAQLLKIADSIPNEKDVTCTRCGKYRRVKDSTLCFRCLYNVSEDELNYCRENSPV